MPFNKNSLILADFLKGEADPEVSLKAMAKFNRGLGALPFVGPTQKAAAPSFWDSLFSGAKTAAMGVVSQAATLPLEKEIGILNSKKHELTSLKFQAQDILNKAVPRLLARKSLEADTLASQLSTGANNGISGAAPALSALDSAIAAAEVSKKQILSGVLPAKAMALYAGKKLLAENRFNAARLPLIALRSAWQAAERKLLASESLIKNAKGEAGAFFSEVGSKISRTASGIEQGFEGALPVLKYWPWIAGGLVGVYVLTLLPRPRRD